MGVPIVYRKTGESTTTSFDFYDFSTGAGYKQFYAMDGYVSTTNTFYLSTEALDSAVGYTTADNAAIDRDFDLPLAMPMTIDGYVLVNVPVWIHGGAGAASSDVTVKIYKVVGATETQLGDSFTVTCTGNNDDYTMCGGKIDVPVTTFGVGDIIRLNVAATAGGQAGTSTVIYHDPKNRSTTAEVLSNQLVVDIPFKINL